MKIIIKIKQSAADAARPAIWFCEQGGKTFRAAPSKEYKGYYEILDGEFKGKIIHKHDFLIYNN